MFKTAITSNFCCLHHGTNVACRIQSIPTCFHRKFFIRLNHQNHSVKQNYEQNADAKYFWLRQLIDEHSELACVFERLWDLLMSSCHDWFELGYCFLIELADCKEKLWNWRQRRHFCSHAKSSFPGCFALSWSLWAGKTKDSGKELAIAEAGRRWVLMGRGRRDEFVSLPPMQRHVSVPYFKEMVCICRISTSFWAFS